MSTLPFMRGALGLLFAVFHASALAAPTLTNGGFESGLSGWTIADQAGGDGTFFLQSGTQTPLSDPSFPVAVPAPPGGSNAVMSDAFGPGAHLLYQDFVASPGVALLNFDLFILNGGGEFESPDSLLFDLTDPIGENTQNQQIRVDILLVSALLDPFSLDPSDVLANLFITLPGDVPPDGYTTITTDLTALMASHAGQTLRLRFAETDNLGPLNLGVDNVRFDTTTVPEPGSLLLVGAALAALYGAMRRR
ncbi:MAG: PEP-CTERM sorting domain-containing protein [Methyloversatilis sp.]|uniref:PEP-CTERM sorting domain-containing protein n=1 Tax=Methyloversatilis sp. TaxID=2569862 RepID=UPI002736AA72|nr:PEP-CTERM sorting domain-containing protein [Methyloversatilis sp.]MDP3872812.1 PEP-CTERM sorting domain-containing protein [Methyloversatilis sp.]